MPDQKLSVGIETPLEDQGILKGIEHFKEFHKLMHTVSEASPALGLALRAVFSPMGAIILGVTIALRSAIGWLEEFERKGREAGTAAAEGFNDARESINRVADELHKMQVEQASLLKELARVKPQDELERELTVINAQVEAYKKLVALKRELNGEDKETAAGRAEGAGDAAKLQELKGLRERVRKQVDDAAKAQASAAAIAPGDPERLKAEAERNAKAAEEARKKAAELVEESKGGFSEDVMNQGPIGQLIAKATGKDQASLDEKAAKQEDIARRATALANAQSDAAARAAAAEEARKKKVEEATKALNEAAAAFNKLDQQIKTLEATTAISAKSRSDIQSLGFTNRVLDTAEELASEKTLSPGEKSFVQQIGSLEAGKPVSFEVAQKILMAASRSQKAQDTVLNRVLSALEALEAKSTEQHDAAVARLSRMESQISTTRLNVPGF